MTRQKAAQMLGGNTLLDSTGLLTTTASTMFDTNVRVCAGTTAGPIKVMTKSNILLQCPISARLKCVIDLVLTLPASQWLPPSTAGSESWGLALQGGDLAILHESKLLPGTSVSAVVYLAYTPLHCPPPSCPACQHL
jgi:hypothetical protein